MPALRLHAVARCCWCGGPFVQWGAWWVCGRRACQARQLEYAVLDRAGNPLHIPTPKQVEFESCAAPNLLGGGAAGGTKSHGCRWAKYRRALTIQGYEGLLLRRTYPELEMTHLRRMQRDAPMLGAEYIESKRLMRFPQTGSLIQAGHCDTDDDLTKHLSTEYDDIDVDEGSTFEGDWLLELQTRTERVSKAGLTGPRFRVWSNPGGRGALWLLDFFIDQAPDPERYPSYRAADWAFIQARVWDNPYLSETYAERLKQLPPARRRQLLDGDWRVFDGQFFGEWLESVHVRDVGRIGPDVRRICGLDWGYNAPGCCLWVACLPDGHYHVEAEYKFNGAVTTRVTVKEVAAEIHRRSKELGLKKTPLVAMDPATKQRTGQVGESILETFQRWRVPAEASNNDRVNGWQRIHELLRGAPDGVPWLTVDPGCRYLIRTLPAAIQAEANADDMDSDGEDHALDALRYWAMSRPIAGSGGRSRKVPPPWSLGWLKQQAQVPQGILARR